MKLILPYPPSDNRYYRIANNRRFLSKEGNDFKLSVLKIFQDWNYKELKTPFQASCHFKKPVAINILVMPPDRRKRDILNLCKAIGDALTYARIIDDDSLIHDANVLRGEVCKGGSIIIEIGEI